MRRLLVFFAVTLAVTWGSTAGATTDPVDGGGGITDASQTLAYVDSGYTETVTDLGGNVQVERHHDGIPLGTSVGSGDAGATVTYSAGTDTTSSTADTSSSTTATDRDATTADGSTTSGTMPSSSTTMTGSAANGAFADVGYLPLDCCSWSGCDTVDWYESGHSALGNLIYRFHQVKHWCWTYPRITYLTIGTYVSNLCNQCEYRGVVGSAGWYYSWSGSAYGGHYSFREGEMQGCIWGYCWWTSYPWTKIWVNGNGAWKGDDGTY
jgi:hypothetical protein